MSPKDRAALKDAMMDAAADELTVLHRQVATLATMLDGALQAAGHPARVAETLQQVEQNTRAELASL